MRINLDILKAAISKVRGEAEVVLRAPTGSYAAF